MISDYQYHKAIIAIEQIHSKDITQEQHNGSLIPAEFLYGKRMLKTLELVSPESSYAMKLAVQCQHLQRWGVPRSSYTYDRRGYHEWRREVMKYQLEQTINLLSSISIDEIDIKWIAQVINAQENKADSNGLIIMDTACLVFLKWYMEPFAKKHESEKVLDILKKTFRKMSTDAQNLISKLDLPESSLQVLNQAIR